jgi:hypothetical protein
MGGCPVPCVNISITDGARNPFISSNKIRNQQIFFG